MAGVKGGMAKKIMTLLLALAGVAAFVMLVHLLSPTIPGAAGEVFRSNRANDIDATALIYTESGDVRDYFDECNGKYGLALDWRGQVKN